MIQTNNYQYDWTTPIKATVIERSSQDFDSSIRWKSSIITKWKWSKVSMNLQKMKGPGFLKGMSGLKS